MEEVKKWLESKTADYSVGTALFARYCKNRSIYNYLVRVGEKRGMSKLIYELQKIAKVEHKVAKQAVTKTDNTNEIVQKTEQLIILQESKIQRDKLPEELIPLYDKNVEDYKIMRGAHAAMVEAKSKNAAKKLRTQIVELDEKIAERWEKLDQWHQTNELPDDLGDEEINKDIVIGEDGKLTPKQVNAIRTYISRAMAEPDKIDDEKRVKIQQRITAMITDGQSFDEQTIKKLNELNFTTESTVHQED